MTQALYAHMNNKTNKQTKEQKPSVKTIYKICKCYIEIIVHVLNIVYISKVGKVYRGFKVMVWFLILKMWGILKNGFKSNLKAANRNLKS
jgi:hypothetical protein